MPRIPTTTASAPLRERLQTLRAAVVDAVRPAAGGEPGPAVRPAGPTKHYAPDGMEVNAPAARPAQALSRAAVIEQAKTADVPQRVQKGGTCGLYALGMVFDFWHRRDPKNACPVVLKDDLTDSAKQRKGPAYTFPPTTDERILDVAIAKGLTGAGEMFSSQLAQLGAHFGYTASVALGATMADLYRVIDAGHPAIVNIDVDYNGNPSDMGGARGHAVVIEGYVDLDGERYLIAKHGWGIEKDHVWRARDFERSWDALAQTTYYREPGDGAAPGSFPDVPRGPPGANQKRTPIGVPGSPGICEPLGRAIVEVVPAGEAPVVGRIVAAP